MDCKMCDYYKVIGISGSGTEISKCEFTNTLFGHDVDMISMDYPCMSFEKESSATLTSKKAINPRNSLVFCGDSWRYFYMHNHPQSGIDRYKKRSLI